MSKRTYEEYIKNGCHPVGYNEPCQSYYFGQVSVDWLLDQIDQLKQQLAEKDKEIEDWKQKTQTFLNRVSEQNYEIANNDPTQLAIQELEKVKNFVDGRTYCANYIKKRIKELEGE